jgi:hypothetical protein
MSISFRRPGCRLITAFLLLWLPVIMSGQFVRGTILGVVSDATGAVVPKASVTLRNAGTNETKSTVTDETGNYAFPALLPGSYSLEVKQTGFQSRLVSDVNLQVNQTARIDIKLTVGEVAEQIEVAADAVLLKTDTSEIGHVVTNKQIVDLPLNGRDYLNWRG